MERSQLAVGMTVIMKKVHPCGCARFCITRVGADIGAQCLQCGRTVLLPRLRFEKAVKGVAAPDA